MINESTWNSSFEQYYIRWGEFSNITSKMSSKTPGTCSLAIPYKKIRNTRTIEVGAS